MIVPSYECLLHISGEKSRYASIRAPLCRNLEKIQILIWRCTMNFRNNGSKEHEILQNRFTAYIMTSIRRECISYLKAKSRRMSILCDIDEEQMQHLPDETDFVSDYANSEVLGQALKQLNDRERYVLIARVIHGKDFYEIGAELAMKYKAVAAIYYRTIANWRADWRGCVGSPKCRTDRICSVL